MAGTAVRGRLADRVLWRRADLIERRYETANAVTLVLDAAGWPGHLPGQHVDVRLTAEDGYSTQRSYSLAAPHRGEQVELTVQVVPDGEVSPFLARGLAIGDPIEVRGPVGGWFVWEPDADGHVMLIGGGSGVVPLMAMVRARQEAGNGSPMRLVYSVRTPQDVFYANKISEFRCYWPDVRKDQLRDASELDTHVPDGRFWLVLSYRKETTVEDLVDDAKRDAEQLDAFKVTGGAAMLFDGIDGPSTRPSAAAREGEAPAEPTSTGSQTRLGRSLALP